MSLAWPGPAVTAHKAINAMPFSPSRRIRGEEKEERRGDIEVKEGEECEMFPDNAMI